jgi:signal transduction histidine kinase
MLDIITNVRNRYRWALFAVALLISGSAILLQYCFSVQKYDAKIINIAGKQRMLSQKIAWHSNALLSSDAQSTEHSRSLRLSLNTFADAHKYLLSKNEYDNYLFLTPELIDLYTHKLSGLDAAALLYIEQATKVLNKKSNVDRDSFSVVRVEALLKQLDKAVSLFEQAAVNKVNWVSKIELGCWLVAILLLLLELKFVFIPMEKAVVKGLQKYQKQKDFAEQVSKNKEHFIARASHEFRTPLQGLISSIDELTVSEQQRAVKKQANYCAHRLLAMLDELQDLQALSLGKWSLHFSTENLKHALENVFLAYEYACAQKSLALSTHINDELNCSCTLDHGRLQQVLTELMSNAVKYTEQGVISVSAQLKNKQLTVVIKDSGVGFHHSVNDLELNSTVQSTHFQGLRTGIARVQYIVRAFNGDISFSNNDDGGAVVTLTMPVSVVENKKLPSNITPAHCLIVEDNTMNTMLLTRILTLLNLSCDCAENGKIACEMVAKNKYDLVFMDLNMPVMDGYQATKRIRTKLNQNVPIIVVTANTSDQDIALAYKCGADAHLHKPIKKEDISNVITSVL